MAGICLKDVYVLLGEIQKTCFFSEDDCHPTLTLYSFTNNGWSLQLLGKTWQQLFLRSKRNFPASVGLLGDNKSA